MGLKELFGRGPLSEKKIAKISKLACNPFAQPDTRMGEMYKLLEDGSPAAIAGVLKRFGANANGAIADEDEKKYLENAVADLGDVAKDPLRDYIRSGKQLTYALRAYQRLCGREEAVRFFMEVLEHYGPDDYRSADAKLQLVWQLAENVDDPRVIPCLAPFLNDHGDDVRWAVMDIVEKAEDEGNLSENDKEKAWSFLGPLVTEDEAGPRIAGRAAELLCKREWKVPGDAEALHGDLDADYFIDKKRFVRRRAKRK